MTIPGASSFFTKCQKVSGGAGPKKSNAQCVSSKSCEQLQKSFGGWQYGGKMAAIACGESDNGFKKPQNNPKAKNGCWGDNDSETDGWPHAEAICQEIGARLCTAMELKAGVSMHSGCGHDAARIWSADKCKKGKIDGHMSFVGQGTIPLCSPDYGNNAVRCCADKAASRAIALKQGKKVCDKYGSEQGKCTSSLTCKQLAQRSGKGSWPTKYGDQNICGESDNGFGRHHTRQCFGGQKGEAPIGHHIAEAICTTVGARLCTVEEVKADETRGTGCSHDGRLVWTSDDVGCAPGQHVAWPGSSYRKLKGKCISDSNTGRGWQGAAVRCCADAVVGTPCTKVHAPIPPPPPSPGSTKKMVVYVINSQGQCGQASFPAAWKRQALAWLKSQSLTARAGTCSSAGYTKKVGTKPVPLSGAPVASLYVQLYAKGAEYLEPVVTQLSTSLPGHITVRVSVNLLSGAKNVYTLFGDTVAPMILPPAFQSKVIKTDIGGIDPMMLSFDKTGTAKFDSWITIGATKGEDNGVSTVGIGFDSWTETQGLTIKNGAIFFMNPDKGPTSPSIVVAQLTMTPSAARHATLKMGIGGRSPRGGQDFRAHLDFSAALRLAASASG